MDENREMLIEILARLRLQDQLKIDEMAHIRLKVDGGDLDFDKDNVHRDYNQHLEVHKKQVSSED